MFEQATAKQKRLIGVGLILAALLFVLAVPRVRANWVALKLVERVYDSAESIFDAAPAPHSFDSIEGASQHIEAMNAYYSADFAAAISTMNELDAANHSDTLYALLLVEAGRSATVADLTNEQLQRLSAQSLPAHSFGEKYLAQHVQNEALHLLVKDVHACIKASDAVCYEQQSAALAQFAPNHWAAQLLALWASEQLDTIPATTFAAAVNNAAWHSDDGLLFYVEDVVSDAIAAGTVDYDYVARLIDLLAWQNGPARATTYVDRLLLRQPNEPQLLAIRGSLALRANEPELAWQFQQAAARFGESVDWQASLCCFVDEQMACVVDSADFSQYATCIRTIYQSEPADVAQAVALQTGVSADTFTVEPNLIANGSFSAELDRASWYFTSWAEQDAEAVLPGNSFAASIDGAHDLAQPLLRVVNFSQRPNERAAYYYYEQDGAAVTQLTLQPDACYALTMSYKISQQTDAALGFIRVSSPDANETFVDENFSILSDASWSQGTYPFCNSGAVATKVDIVIGNNTMGELLIDNVTLAPLNSSNASTLIDVIE